MSDVTSAHINMLPVRV